MLLLVLSAAFAAIVRNQNVFLSDNDPIGDNVYEKNRRENLSGY